MTKFREKFDKILENLTKNSINYKFSWICKYLLKTSPASRGSTPVPNATTLLGALPCGPRSPHEKIHVGANDNNRRDIVILD